MEEYRLDKVLGKGSYGIVRKAIEVHSEQEFAVKVFSKSVLTDDNLNRIFAEAEIMRDLKDHPNIIKFIDLREDEKNIYLFMQYAPGGDLLEYVSKNGRVAEEEAKVIFLQIIDMLLYTHSKNFVHRDVKLENILLDETKKIPYLCDWGFSTRYDINEPHTCTWGSVHYAAPEVCSGTPHVGPEVDIWSLGVLLYGLTTGFLPFGGSESEEISQNIKEGSFIIPSFLSSSLTRLIQKMLVVDISKRITLVEVRKHRWLRSITRINGGSVRRTNSAIDSLSEAANEIPMSARAKSEEQLDTVSTSPQTPRSPDNTPRDVVNFESPRFLTSPRKKKFSISALFNKMKHKKSDDNPSPVASPRVVKKQETTSRFSSGSLRKNKTLSPRESEKKRS